MTAVENEHIQLDEELGRQARLLRESEYFVWPIEDASMAAKQDIFLVLAGLKPVSETTSGHWVPHPGGQRTVADDPKEVGRFLESLGLAYHLAGDERGTDAVVALRPELVEEYVRADDSSSVGRLFGYPESAVAAFVKGECMPVDEQERIEGYSLASL